MKGIVYKLSLAILLVATSLTSVLAQERTQITVKKTHVVTGVLLVEITKVGKPFTLQCNDGQPTCKNLKPGTYWMLELPENHGMYDCKNAEIYAGDKDPGDEPEDSERIGAYCEYDVK